MEGSANGTEGYLRLIFKQINEEEEEEEVVDNKRANIFRGGVGWQYLKLETLYLKS